MLTDTYAGIAPVSAPAFIAAQVIGGALGTALAVVLYPGQAGQPATMQEPARLAG
jgi:glycerol uptake facilitator-like aquaporin